MKQESDRQLKAQWDAATLKDFEFDIDTEKLWQKIDKPGAGRKVTFSWLKYAAAVISGAVLTLFINRLNTPKEVAMQPLMQVGENRNGPAISAPVSRQPASVTHQNTGQQATVAVKSSPLTGKPTAATRLSLAKLPGVAAALNNNTQPEQSQVTVPESRQTPVTHPEPNTIAGKAPKPALQTVHLFDLENPAPEPAKPSKLMMAIGEHTNPKANDIAFSTKILTKQF